MIGGKKKVLAVGAAVVIAIVVIVTIVVLVNRDAKRGTVSSDKYVSSSLLGRYTKGAVTTNGQECAQIGSDVLNRNGTAVDAAIAALLCEGVACLHSMGLGGGFLMTIWNAKTRTADFLDAREVAPLAATEDMFNGSSTLSTIGGLAVAVPGELAGYWEAHQKYGKLPWAELFEPTIALCARGSLVTNYLASYLSQKEAAIKREPTLAAILIDPATNSTWRAGDRIKRPTLAKTLARIATGGAEIFYNGSIAEQLVSEIQAFGGIITREDLRGYRPKWRAPITARIGNWTLHTAPPPGSGVLLAFMMNVLRGIAPADDEGDTWQRVVETFKWAYARRTELGDPDFVDIGSVFGKLTSDEYADATRRKIRDDWTSNDPGYYGAVTSNVEDHGTAHISVLAPDGSAVAVTSTINLVLGAMIRSTSTGIIFNDEMDDFSSPRITNEFGLPASPANYIAPGKRPLSSMTPTILLDENEEVRLVVGAAGGTKITTGVASAMLLNLWSGYDIKEAIDARRIHHQLFPMTVENEGGFPQPILDHLRSVGHNVSTYRGIGSAVTAIARGKDGSVTANSDYRREGKTAGF